MLRIKNLLRRSATPSEKATDGVFNQYSHDLPGHQNAIDLLPGWNSAFPAHTNLQAGVHPLFADGRIKWAIGQFGPLDDKKILEIGPLEGMHTYMLNSYKPALIDAIEANKQCFLRCLVTKEVLGIDRAHFYLGDALRWLEEKDVFYDLAIASGVLYHMADPGQFLCALAKRCDSLFIWTHYFDDAAMPAEDLRRLAFSGNSKMQQFGNISVRYYERRYFNANANNDFCGGMKDRHYWMHRDDIIGLLAEFGFADIVISQDDPNHSGGPCFSLFAKRNSATQKG